MLEAASLQPPRPRQAQSLCEDKSRMPEASSLQPPGPRRAHYLRENQTRTPEAASLQPLGPRQTQEKKPAETSCQPPRPRRAHYLYALINRDDRPTLSRAFFSKRGANPGSAQTTGADTSKVRLSQAKRRCKCWVPVWQ